jgi:hypothetical protein
VVFIIGAAIVNATRDDEPVSPECQRAREAVEALDAQQREPDSPGGEDITAEEQDAAIAALGESFEACPE